MKKGLMFILIFSLCVGTFLPAYAKVADVAKNDINIENITDEDNVTIERLGETILYTYQEDDFVYCSQMESDGTMVFSYTSEDNSQIYQSQPFNVNDNFGGDIMSDLNNLTVVNTVILKNFDKFNVYIALNLNQSEYSLQSASSNVESIVTATFGSNYTNLYLKSATRSYDKTYTLRCHGYQSTYCLQNAAFSFAAKTAISTITAWIAASKFSFSVSWLLGAAAVATTIYDGVKCINAALQGNAYFYECNRIRRVTIPSYTSDVLYSASWVLKYSFVYTNASWASEEEFSYKQPAYDDYDNLFNTAFNRFVVNYLLP